MRARGLGANVIVTEVDPLRALEAVMDGFRVMPMIEAARIGDVFVTSTGDIHVIDRHHLQAMKDGAIVCNTGHYDVEINIPELEEISVSKRTIRPNCEEYTLKSGKKIFLLAQGRLVNLAAAEGHPSEVMDMSFANQFMSHLLLVQKHEKGEKIPLEVLDLPVEQDEFIAKTKLEMMDINIDKLTDAQINYINDYNAGT